MECINKLTKKVVFARGSDAWLSRRSHNITATEVASLVGLNPYKSAPELLRQKLGTIRRLPPNPAMRRGHILEKAVGEAVLYDLDWPVGFYEEGDDIIYYEVPSKRISATPDAFVTVDGKQALLECKTVRLESFDKWSFAPPFYYLTQLLTQIYVMGTDEGYIAGLGAGDPFPLTVFHMKYSEEAMNLLITQVEKFWYAIGNDEKYVTPRGMGKKIQELLVPLLTRVQ